MDHNNILQNRLMGRTVNILSRVLDFRSASQGVISENLANVDTPGYKPKELRFDQELQRASEKREIHLNTTNPNHFSDGSASNAGRGPFPVETIEEGTNGTGQLNIDAEMAKMMRNNLLYEATTRLLSKKIKALKTVIDESRR